MLYAAFYNLAAADKAARTDESRRSSANITTPVSEEKTKKSTLKKILNSFRATEEEYTPSGIYAPIIKNGPLFQGLKPAEHAQKPTPIYQRERPLFSSGRSQKRASSTSSSSASSTASHKA